MTTDVGIALTPEAFIESAKEFAAGALEAHDTGNFRRVAVDAGTALEHLAKACLASRSSGLLAELRGEGSFDSLCALLGYPGDIASTSVRTVSLRDALDRLKKLKVKSFASPKDVQTLIAMRDGTVHAARNDEVEDQLVVAFVSHCNALLDDLKVPPAEFWAERLPIVEALLADSASKVGRRVAARIASARNRMERRARTAHPQVFELEAQLEKELEPEFDFSRQVPYDCPICQSVAVASGPWEVKETDKPNGEIQVRFTVEAFVCARCGLRLESPAEVSAAGMEPFFETD